MMHARYATHGAKDEVTNAHPYPSVRDGRTALVGMHNGVLGGTYATARQNGRTHTVDSREFFELLADKDYASIRGLDGYGVVTWTVPGETCVRLLRLSRDSDIVAYRLTCGAIVWASTELIADVAIGYAGLETESELSLSDIGQVYKLKPGKVVADKLRNLQVSSWGFDEHWGGGHWGGQSYRKNQAGLWERFTDSDSGGGEVYDLSTTKGSYPAIRDVDFRAARTDDVGVTPISESDRQQDDWDRFFQKHPEFSGNAE
jgi:hypothetical protein